MHNNTRVDLRPEEAPATHFWKSRDRWGVSGEPRGLRCNHVGFTAWRVGARGVVSSWVWRTHTRKWSRHKGAVWILSHWSYFYSQAGMMEKTWVRFCYENTLYLQRHNLWPLHLMEASVSQILIKQSHMCVTVMSPRKEKYRGPCWL